MNDVPSSFDQQRRQFVEGVIEDKRRQFDKLTDELVAGETEQLWFDVNVLVADVTVWMSALMKDIDGHGYSKNRANAVAASGIDMWNTDHFATGLLWLRNLVAHGGAHLVAMSSLGVVGDASWRSEEVLWNDHLPYDLSPDHPTIRFVGAPDSTEWRQVLQGADHLLPFFEHCIAGRRVQLIAGLVLGEGTLAGRGFGDVGR